MTRLAYFLLAYLSFLLILIVAVNPAALGAWGAKVRAGYVAESLR